MSLQIHLTAGSHAGQRLLAQSGSVTFGREPGNTLVVDLAEVSRRHGELQLSPEGGWILINHSPNGTLLGKKNITTKPGAILGDVSVFIGKVEIMRLSAAAQAAKTAGPEAAEAARPPAKGGMKLMLYIVCGLSLCGIVVAAFLPSKNTGSGTVQTGHEFMPMTDKQLVKMIEAPPANPYPPDSAKYEEAIRAAKDLYAPTNMARKAWLAAYKAYREAMRYNGQELREPGDKADYAAVCAAVTKIVTNDYNEACSAYNRMDYVGASRDFAKINGYAGLSDTPLFGTEFRGHLLKIQGFAEAKRKK